jgi:hypothetical protein
MEKAIVFDMDGTIADLYGVENWLDMLRNENPQVYADARPMWNMAQLNEVLTGLRKVGWKIIVVTWLSKDSSESYKAATRKAKLDWLNRYNFPFDSFHGVRYGATKADSIRKKVDYGILVDDNEKVRKGWSLGNTIDPTTTDIIEALKEVL